MHLILTHCDECNAPVHLTEPPDEHTAYLCPPCAAALDAIIAEADAQPAIPIPPEVLADPDAFITFCRSHATAG